MKNKGKKLRIFCERGRIFFFILFGAFMMFLVQRWIFTNKIITLGNDYIDPWIDEEYIPGSEIVFVFSVISTIVWYILAANAKLRSAHAGGKEDIDKWRKFWGLFLFIPILGICLAIRIFISSDDARVSLIVFYIVDVILLFYLPTATSTPGDLKYVPPFAEDLRRIIGD